MYLCLCSAGSRCSVTVSRRLWAWRWTGGGKGLGVRRAAWRIWPGPSLMTSDGCQETTTAVTAELQVIDRSIHQSINASSLLFHIHPPLTKHGETLILSLCRSWMALDQPGHPDLYWVFRDPQGDGGPRLQDPVSESGQSGDLRPAGRGNFVL